MFGSLDAVLLWLKCDRANDALDTDSTWLIREYVPTIPGESWEALSAIEAAMGVPLHPDLKAIWHRINWGREPFGNLRLASADFMLGMSGGDAAHINSVLRTGCWAVGSTDGHMIFVHSQTGEVFSREDGYQDMLKVADGIEQFICLVASAMALPTPDRFYYHEQALPIVEAFLADHAPYDSTFLRCLAMGWA